MFTVVVREAGDTKCGGSIMRTLTTDPEDAVMLCRGEIGTDSYQTGTCTVNASTDSRLSIGGSKGGTKDVLAHSWSNFFHFHAAFEKIIGRITGFHAHLWSWHPLRKILDPPRLRHVFIDRFRGSMLGRGLYHLVQFFFHFYAFFFWKGEGGKFGEIRGSGQIW